MGRAPLVYLVLVRGDNWCMRVAVRKAIEVVLVCALFERRSECGGV